MSTSNSVQLATNQADSVVLSNGLAALQQSLYDAAAQNIDTAIEGGSYTALQRRSMILAEALRLTTGIDLSTIITRGAIIRQIEQEGLAGVHPNGYADLSALARENGVGTVSELSDIRTLCDVVFPYIQDTLHWNLVEVWEAVGKSNFREMAPALRSLITGEAADHASVRTAIENMLNTAAIALAEELHVDSTQLTPSDVSSRAIATLLQDGITHTTREMRRRVRPSRVPLIEMATLQTAGDQWYVVMKLDTTEKKDLALRIFNSHSNNMELDGRADEHRSLRRTLGSFFGDR